MMVSCVPQYVSSWPIAIRALSRSWACRRRTLPTMMTRTNKMKRMTKKTMKTKSQPSSDRTNVDAKHSGLWLLEITDYF